MAIMYFAKIAGKGRKKMKKEDDKIERFVKELELKGTMCLPASYALGCREGKYRLKIFMEENIYKLQLEDGKDYIKRMPTLGVRELYDLGGEKFCVKTVREQLQHYIKQYEEAAKVAEKEKRELSGLLEIVPKERIITFLVPRDANGTDMLLGRHHNNAYQVYGLLREEKNEVIQINLITEEFVKKWGITEDTLYELAIRNMSESFPYQLQKMQCGYGYGEVYLIDTYFHCFGTASLFYKESPLKELALEYSRDLYIFPLSIHEVVVFPVSENLAETEVLNIAEEISPFGRNLWYYNKDLKKLVFSKKEKSELQLQAKEGIADASERRRMNAVF